MSRQQIGDLEVICQEIKKTPKPSRLNRMKKAAGSSNSKSRIV